MALHMPGLRASVLATACLAVMVTVTGAGVRAQDQANRAPVSFNRDVLPILSNNCFACHGPDEQQRKTRFHFDTREGAFAKRGVIEPGNAADSLLIEMVTHPDPKQRMPPLESGHTLTEKQISVLRRWIDGGAAWDTHWAYTAAKRPEPPATRRAGWARNPIDQFILARLEREGLQPSPEADKETLLRRVTYDLTGLPPTPAEVDAFLADKSPDAYEKRVDALLQSPHYGERMAMAWLDAARYADTHGYHIDSYRQMWPWRDWVIGAFNRNLPFDQFVIEQIAGDLIPNATRDQKMASGFNRNHMINFEGGAIADEYQVEYVVDRVEATSSAFMGLTMGCARCHTHKYDPITHKEFYQFFAFFNSVPERGLDGRLGNAAPVLPLPSHAQQARLDELDAAIEARTDALAEAVVEPAAARVGEDAVAARCRAHRTADGAARALRARRKLLRHLRPVSARPHGHRRSDVRRRPGGKGRVASMAIPRSVSATSARSIGRIGSRPPFGCGRRGSQPMHVLQKLNDAQGRRGYEWRFDDIVLVGIQRWAARLTITLASDSPAGAIEIRTRERLRFGDWHHLALTYDGSGKAAGVRLYVGGAPADVEVVRDTLAGPIASDAPLRLGSRDLGQPFLGRIDDLRLYGRVLAPEQIANLAIHYPARAHSFRRVRQAHAGRRRRRFATTS